MRRFDVVIGNPPYGSGGNLAIKFLNKSGDLSDEVKYVLPLSVRKASSLNKIRLDLLCVSDIQLPDSTFPGGIRAVNQTWVNATQRRKKVLTLTTHPDFEFVKREEADCMIGRAGSGPVGRLKTSNFLHYSNENYFLKLTSPVVLQNLKTIEPLLREEALKHGNGRATLSKHELVSLYSERYGRGLIHTTSTHPDFEFVKKGDKRTNVFVMRSGYAGKVMTEDYDKYEWSHYFLSARTPEVISNLRTLEPKLREVASVTNGMNKLSKHELVSLYSEHYGYPPINITPIESLF